MVKPITPQEVVKTKQVNLPEEVITSFNQLIAKHWSNGRATIKTREAVATIAEALQIGATEIYKQHYLDVEEIYRKAGWQVTYDQPAYNESYDAHFVFQNPDGKSKTNNP